MHITGAAFRDFYLNHWPKGWYVDDMPYTIEDENGVLLVQPEDEVDLTNAGYAQWEGGPDGRDFLRQGETDRDHVCLDVFYTRVMGKTPNAVYLLLQADPDTLRAVRPAVEAAGMRLIG